MMMNRVIKEKSQSPTFNKFNAVCCFVLFLSGVSNFQNSKQRRDIFTAIIFSDVAVWEMGYV